MNNESINNQVLDFDYAKDYQGAHLLITKALLRNSSAAYDLYFISLDIFHSGSE